MRAPDSHEKGKGSFSGKKKQEGGYTNQKRASMFPVINHLTAFPLKVNFRRMADTKKLGGAELDPSLISLPYMHGLRAAVNKREREGASYSKSAVQHVHGTRSSLTTR